MKKVLKKVLDFLNYEGVRTLTPAMLIHGQTNKHENEVIGAKAQVF
jgi:hypothetical protein